MRNYGSAHSGLFGPPMMGGQRTMEDLGRGNFGNTPTWGGVATGPSSFGQTFQGTGTPRAVGQMQAPGMGGYGAPQLGGTGLQNTLNQIAGIEGLKRTQGLTGTGGGGDLSLGNIGHTGGNMAWNNPQDPNSGYRQGGVNLGQMLQQILGQFNVGQLGNMYGLGPTPAAPGAGAGQPVPIGGPSGRPLADMTGWTQNPTGGGWSRPGPGGVGMQEIIA